MENKKPLQEQYTELIQKLNTMAEEHILEGKYTHEEVQEMIRFLQNHCLRGVRYCSHSR